MEVRSKIEFHFKIPAFFRTSINKSDGGKASIALARKFLGVIYHTLKNNWVFEDFPRLRLPPENRQTLSAPPRRSPDLRKEI